MTNKKNNKITREDVLQNLAKQIDDTSHFYKKNVISDLYLYCNKDKKFISDILNECINDIFSNLQNGIYLFKYEIYGKNIVQPYLMFLSKDELKKLTIFNINEEDYKNTIFGIRLDFIDPDANRYSFFIIIE